MRSGRKPASSAPSFEKPTWQRIQSEKDEETLYPMLARTNKKQNFPNKLWAIHKCSR